MEHIAEDVEHYLRRHWRLRLQREHRRVASRYGVPLAPVFIDIHEGSSQSGRWDARARVISISRELIRRAAWDVVVEVLKHEMAHQLVTDRLGGGDAHGPLFRQACQALRVAAWAMTASGALPEHMPDWRRDPDGEDSEAHRLLRRAEKLLALAESANEHEAALAMQRVRELYARHNLDQLVREVNPDWVSCVVPLNRKRIEGPDSLIASILNAHFFVTTLSIETWDAASLTESKAFEILGTRQNVELAEYVFHFLRHRIEVLWRQHRAETGVPGAARRDYLMGLLTGFRRKLDEPVVAAPEERALLRRADAALQDFLHERYPRLQMRRFQRGGRDPETFHAGVAKGREITIHRGVGADNGNRGRLIGHDN